MSSIKYKYNSYNNDNYSDIITDTEQLSLYLSNINNWGDECYIVNNSQLRREITIDGKVYSNRIKSIAYMLSGKIVKAKNKKIVESCNNINCINPNHLKLIDNPGRTSKNTLSNIQKDKIYKKYLEGVSKTDLAKLFGCSENYIYSIVKEYSSK